MTTKLQAWTIKQLNEARIEALNACHSPLERNMCNAICGKEIREKAIEWAKVRKLTPFEVAIAEQFGYRG